MHPAPARAGRAAGELDSALSFVIAAAAITPDRRELLSNVPLVRKYRSARRQAHGRESAGAASAPHPVQSWASNGVLGTALPSASTMLLSSWGPAALLGANRGGKGLCVSASICACV